MVVEEFQDRGETGKNARRPGLRALLANAREHDIDYFIVHKVDRLARNRADDVEICGSPRIVEGFPMRLPGRGPRCFRS